MPPCLRKIFLALRNCAKLAKVSVAISCWSLYGSDKMTIVGSTPPINVICLRISGCIVISRNIFKLPIRHLWSSVSSKFVSTSKPPESMMATCTYSFFNGKSAKLQSARHYIRVRKSNKWMPLFFSAKLISFVIHLSDLPKKPF